MFDELSGKIGTLLQGMGGKAKSLDEVIDWVEKELRASLISADVAEIVIDEIAMDVRSSLVRTKPSPGQEAVEAAIAGFEEGVMRCLGRKAAEPRLPTVGSAVWMLVGLQGTGKTTSAAKLALWARQAGHRPYLVPLDLRRPAAIEQLTKLGESLDIPVFPVTQTGNPAKIAHKAIAQAQKQNCNLVIIDTAGRLAIDEELMNELQSIRKKIKPDETLLVVDGMQGQTAVDSARRFDRSVAVSGMILTKMDGDARGGAALSARQVTGKPIKFLGLGEKPEDLELFDPKKIVNRILDRGDLEALASKAEKELDLDKVNQLGQKMFEDKFTLEDFRAQMEQMEKLGSMEQILGMMPGGKKIKKMVGDFGEAQKQLVRTKAIIGSMTPLERRNTRLLNQSRRRRIATGSGSNINEVNRLLKDFEKMRKMIKQMKRMNPSMLAGMGKKNLPF